jgi:hypothetical protein
MSAAGAQTAARTRRLGAGVGLVLACALIGLMAPAARAADRVSGRVDTPRPEVGLALKVTLSGRAEAGDKLDAAALPPGQRCVTHGPVGVNGFFISVVARGTFRRVSTITLPSNPSGDGPGRWTLCLYLARAGGRTVTASDQVPFSVRGPRVKLSVRFRRGSQPPGFPYMVTTSSDQPLYLPFETVVAQPVGAACAPSLAADLARHGARVVQIGRGQVPFGTVTLAYRGPLSGTWRVCAWVEGPPAGLVDARAGALASPGPGWRPVA